MSAVARPLNRSCGEVVFMWTRIATIGALALALIGAPAIPAAADQHGQKRGHHAAGAMKQKTKAFRPQKATAANGARRSGPQGWSIEQRARLEPLLPPGWTLEQGAAGFENRGQFIAALEASRGHNVLFSQLKHLIVDERLTLGQALRILRP
jgi:hypothetical protein